ncbi:hypothetical protein D9758_014036 [Tetrapyrgos nigripes]|uniref:Uncharacterized protein n=1 Tax=Tetrapyrgos nigripes TaxID=182062 RepID=A0A8H5FUU6_9AGAR|nr:hypothetical protein D9758_014036 [Tetrapyrgos nigripes]
MAFTKSTLISLFTLAAVGTVGAAAQNPNCATGGGFVGHAFPFNRTSLPDDFIPCGGNCPPPSPFTLPIALPSDLFKGADVCCSTFTLTFNGRTAQGTYAYKSSSRAGTQNLALDEDLFDKLGGDVTIGELFPVKYCL